MIVYNHVYINTDDCLALAEVHALWVLSSLPRWLEKQINLPAFAKVLPAFWGIWWYFPLSEYTVCNSAAIFHHTQPDKHVYWEVPANKSTSRAGRWAPQKQSLMRPVKWKHNPCRASPRHNWRAGRKLKPGLLWVVRKSSKPSGKTNIHVCFVLTLSDWMFTN